MRAALAHHLGRLGRGGEANSVVAKRREASRQEDKMTSAYQWVNFEWSLKLAGSVQRLCRMTLVRREANEESKDMTESNVLRRCLLSSE